MTTAAPTQQQYASASLYVGDLHEDVTEAFLYEVFREVGPIVSIRVCRDSITRKSLGYAYVNFQNPEDAERSLDSLNFTTIKGKPIRIMWSQRDPAIRKSGVGNIFIKNLDASIDNKALYDTFSTFGNILSCQVKEKVEKVKVKNEETGEVEEKTVAKGYGFVHFETQQAADQAVAKMNGMLLNGKKVFVAPFQKKNERFKMGTSDKDYTNIFVKNLDSGVSSQQLIELFSKYGKIQHGEVQADDESGSSRGYGFINFESHEAAEAAVQDMNDKEIAGKKVFVARHQSKGERQGELRDKFTQMRIAQQNKWEGQNLYVKNLDDNFDEDRLKQEFIKYGDITSCKIMRDEKGTSKGFGFVCFQTPEAATRALTDMNGKMVGTKPLYVALAQKKELRQAQLEAAHRRGPHMAGPMGAPMGVPGMPGPAGPYGPTVFFPPHPGMPMGRAGPAGPFPPQGMPMRPRWHGPAGPAGARPMGPAGPVPMGPYPGAAAGGAPGMAGPGVGGRGGRGGIRGGRGGGKMRYNQNVRNQRPMDEQQAAAQQQQLQQQQGGMPVHAGQQQQQVPVEQAPVAHHLTLANLANMPPEEQKRVLGEQLFPMVHGICADDAGKITGMLLELEVDLLLELIENPATLEEKVNEAMEVLREHAQQQA